VDSDLRHRAVPGRLHLLRQAGPGPRL